MVHDGAYVNWPGHNSVVISLLDLFMKSEQFVDVTLAADGRHFRVQWLILYACIKYFEVLVFLPGDPFFMIETIASFMYHVEVAISRSLLPLILRTAAELGIKGVDHTYILKSRLL